MVSCFFCPRTLKGDDKVANPHFEIKITKRSKRQSAIAGAAYQSGENLFSEYDQKHKDYRKKEGVVYTEVMLPSHPPGHNPHCHIMLTMRAARFMTLTKTESVSDFPQATGKATRRISLTIATLP